MVALQRALLCCNGSDSAEMVEAARRQWRQSRGSSFAAMVVAALGCLRSCCKGSGRTEMGLCGALKAVVVLQRELICCNDGDCAEMGEEVMQRQWQRCSGSECAVAELALLT